MFVVLHFIMVDVVCPQNAQIFVPIVFNASSHLRIWQSISFGSRHFSSLESDCGTFIVFVFIPMFSLKISTVCTSDSGTNERT